MIVNALPGRAGLRTAALVLAAAPATAYRSCADVHVVAAGGTNEAGGTFSRYHLGTVDGNPVYAAGDDALRRSTDAYRVEYPASLEQPASVQQGNRDLV